MNTREIVCSKEQGAIFFLHLCPCYTPRMSNLTLKQEVELLRSAVIGIIGKDPEGEYQPEFVKSTFEALKRKPTRRFVSSKQFLEDISRA